MSLTHPATIIVCGGTGSGKTELTKAILSNHKLTFQKMPLKPRVLWCFGSVKPDGMRFQDPIELSFHDGGIDEEYLRSYRPDIVVIDDLMKESSNDTFVHNLFTKFSHHLSISVFYITQNLFEKGQVSMKRNAHYILMTRNPSDKSQITTLGRQLFPRRKSSLEHFYEAYEDATRVKFGYLLIDVSPEGDENLKLKTNILPDKNGDLRVVVYQLKNTK